MYISTKVVVISLAFLVLASFGASHPAKADMGAATIYSQGGLLQSTSPATKVSMDDEKVVLTYGQPQRDVDESGQLISATMAAHVTAVFTMKNNGTEAEHLTVYFPANDSAFVGGYGNADGNDITNFTVDGQALGTGSLGTEPAMIGGAEQTIAAYTWTETFEPLQTTQVTVEYDTKSGTDLNAYHLTYVLGTGRGWQGPIKSGTVTFVLPSQLTEYSVIDSSFFITNTSQLPYTVEGNQVIVTFTNYEPESDAAISLGVYENGIVGQIEQLKTEAATFENTLKIAGLFRDLTEGAHCVFCTTKTTEYALDYYDKALDKAGSKNDLDQVLMSFVYRGWTDASLTGLFSLMGFENCAADDTECKATIVVEREKLGDTPLSIRYSSQKFEHLDFLSKYASKVAVYDPQSAGIVNRYIGSADAIEAWEMKQRSDQEAAQVNANSTNSNVRSININEEVDNVNIDNANVVSAQVNINKESTDDSMPDARISTTAASLIAVALLILLTALVLVWKKRRTKSTQSAPRQPNASEPGTKPAEKK